MKRKLACCLGILALLCVVPRAPMWAETGGNAAPTPAEQLVRVILSKGYKRVAVLPRVVTQAAADVSPVKGKNTVGALSMAWPDELYEALIQASLESNGKFAVVTDQQVLQALKGQKSEDVGSDEMWKVIREKTGADFLASIDVTDPGPTEGKQAATEVKRVVNAVDLNNRSAVGRVTQKYRKSLSDGAYAGESFVVREWQGNRLEATGLARNKLFDVGQVAEKDQYENLVPQEHPLMRTDYPYGISIEVNGQPRTPTVIDGQFVVPLEQGEEYVVRVWNRGEREVFMALYVDGVNTIGAAVERPDLTPTNRTWFLKPDQASRKIAGWQHVDPQTREASYEKFVIKSSEESVAREASQPGGDDFGAELGMVTAVFYTYGMKDVPEVRGTPALPTDGIGTGRGEKQVGGVSGFDPNAQQKGLMLSAITIYYRSPQWIQDHPGEAPPTPEVAEVSATDPIPEEPKKTSSEQPAETEEPAKKQPKDSENDLPE